MKNGIRKIILSVLEDIVKRMRKSTNNLFVLFYVYWEELKKRDSWCKIYITMRIGKCVDDYQCKQKNGYSGILF